MVEEIKVLLWKRSLSRLKASPCMFYEWNWCMGDCFGRQEVGIAVQGSFSALFWGYWAVHVAVDWCVFGVTEYLGSCFDVFSSFLQGLGVCLLSPFVALFRRCSCGFSVLFVVPVSVQGTGLWLCLSCICSFRLAVMACDGTVCVIKFVA